MQRENILIKGLEIFVVGTDVDVVGIVDSVDVLLVIGYWLFDVGIVVVEGDWTCEELVFIVVIVFVIVGACAISVEFKGSARA